MKAIVRTYNRKIKLKINDLQKVIFTDRKHHKHTICADDGWKKVSLTAARGDMNFIGKKTTIVRAKDIISIEFKD